MTKNAMLMTDDNVGGALINYGIAGAVLGLFVLPAWLAMLNSNRKREEARDAAAEKDAEARRELEREEWRLRIDRENKLVAALVASVDHQKESLQQINASLRQIADRIDSQHRDLAMQANAQTKVAELLAGVASQLERLKVTP